MFVRDDEGKVAFYYLDGKLEFWLENRPRAQRKGSKKTLRDHLEALPGTHTSADSSNSWTFSVAEIASCESAHDMSVDTREPVSQEMSVDQSEPSDDCSSYSEPSNDGSSYDHSEPSDDDAEADAQPGDSKIRTAYERFHRDRLNEATGTTKIIATSTGGDSKIIEIPGSISYLRAVELWLSLDFAPFSCSKLDPPSSAKILVQALAPTLRFCSSHMGSKSLPSFESHDGLSKRDLFINFIRDKFEGACQTWQCVMGSNAETMGNGTASHKFLKRMKDGLWKLLAKKRSRLAGKLRISEAQMIVTRIFAGAKGRLTKGAVLTDLFALDFQPPKEGSASLIYNEGPEKRFCVSSLPLPLSGLTLDVEDYGSLSVEKCEALLSPGAKLNVVSVKNSTLTLSCDDKSCEDKRRSPAVIRLPKLSQLTLSRHIDYNFVLCNAWINLDDEYVSFHIPLAKRKTLKVRLIVHFLQLLLQVGTIDPVVKDKPGKKAVKKPKKKPKKKKRQTRQTGQSPLKH
ncbi:MAG: hypothetical protein SGARI_000486 [Bacillariaceae sp.]